MVGTCGPRHRSFQARLAGLRVDVVVDGQLWPADLDGLLGADVGPAALEADQLELVRLGCQLGARLLVRHDPAAEALRLLDDLAHALLDRLEVVGAERLGHVEVVVEAVLDRRADPELGVGVQLLHGLRQHVRGRVPQDREPVGRLGADGVHGVAVAELTRQVPQGPVDPRRDHAPAALASSADALASASPAVVPASTTCSRPASVMCSLSAGTAELLHCALVDWRCGIGNRKLRC